MSHEHPDPSGEGPPPPEASTGGTAEAQRSDGPDAPSSALTEDDVEFVEALQSARLLGELEQPEMERIAGRLDSHSVEARRLDLLEDYYNAEGDPERAHGRIRADGFLAHHAEWEWTAREVTAALANLVPETGELILERIGGGNEGALVLRTGDAVSAVLDEYEEQLDSDEIDLRDIEHDRPTVSVRSLVRAFNALLSQWGIRRRLIELLSDGQRELYVATHVAQATALLQQGYLEDEEADELMEFASW